MDVNEVNTWLDENSIEVEEDNIEELENLIREHNIKYTEGNPEISDAEYDDLITKLQNICPTSPVLDDVGARIPSYGKKVKHAIIMGSLSKTKVIEDLNKWYNEHPDEVVWSEKFDGGSGEITYKNGKLVCSSTRGDGLIGQEVTDCVLQAEDIVKILKKPVDIVVRGEFYIRKNFFNENLIGKFANTRNCVSASVQLKDPTEIRGRGVNFMVYRVMEPNLKSLTDEMEYAKTLGLEVAEFHEGRITKEIVGKYEESLRTSLDYEIDGLVASVNNNERREDYGMLSEKYPKGAIAFKFKPQSVVTTVVGIEMGLGRSRKICPVVLLEPTQLAGSIISRCTLHNVKNMLDLKIGIGAKVILRKGGDVIPDIECCVELGDSIFEVPKKCPSCSSDVTFDGVNLWCTNEECGDTVIAGIIYWLKTHEVKEVGEFLIRSLIAVGKMKDIASLYKVTEDDFVGISGVGGRTIEIYQEEIRKIRKIPLAKFITGLGIACLGRTLGKLIAKKVKSIDGFLALSEEDLTGMEGVASIKIKKVLKGVEQKRKLIMELSQLIDIESEKTLTGSLVGKSFCCTGGVYIPRKELQKEIEKRGGEYTSIKKGLSYLIFGEEGKTHKAEKAKKLGAIILDEDQLRELLK